MRTFLILFAFTLSLPMAPIKQDRGSGCANCGQPSTNTTSEDVGIYKVGGDVSAPVLIHSADPQYSEAARAAKYQGVSLLSVVVGANGFVLSSLVMRPLGMGLDEKAMEVVKKYRFKPAMLHGKPVPVRVSLEIIFRIY